MLVSILGEAIYLVKLVKKMRTPICENGIDVRVYFGIRTYVDKASIKSDFQEHL